MKNVLTSVAIALLPTFAMTSHLHAQEFTSETKVASNSLAKGGALRISTPVTFESTSSKLINSSEKSLKDVKKAAREFKQFNKVTKRFEIAYEGVTDVKWTKSKDGYNGSFTRDGLQNMVWYDKGANLTYSMVSYDGQLLADEVRSIVQKNYAGYRISWVSEVHQGGIVVYVVTIEDAKNIKQVTVCDGELNIYQEFTKG